METSFERYIINRSEFDENFRYFDKEMISEVIGMFIKEYPSRFETMSRNIEEKDFTGLAFNAHSLKSVLASFMAPMPSALAARLEVMAKSGTESGLADLFSELQTATLELVRELDRIRDGLAA
ncbi:MAG TPA: Hpt domain-containing protein [Bacteroidales bacterium]|nr:Hpt domain-containing protein [Bacteroidales bacterium]